MDNLTSLFTEKSELVSNITQTCTFDEFRAKTETIGFDYIESITLGLENKNTEITQKGFPSALVEADWAIAETGTVVIESSSEQKRLATCLAEDLHVVLPASKLTAELTDIADFMKKTTADEASFVAFVTGASRTADIERVLTIGVHGPARMFVYIIKDR